VPEASRRTCRATLVHQIDLGVRMAWCGQKSSD
jgi:hypothetical protein